MQITVDRTIDRLAALLDEFKFDEVAAYLAENVEPAHLVPTIHTLAENKNGLLVYAFINDRLRKHETSFWHRCSGRRGGEYAIPENAFCGNGYLPDG